MSVCEALQISRGITAVIGSGGKTTLLHVLAEELSAESSGRVILCTTTRMLPSSVYPTLYDPTPVQIRAETSRVFCAGSRAGNGKIGPCEEVTVRQMAREADYVLVEADGSRRLPLKAHASWEPVIPEETGQVIWVVGASGFGQPAEQCVHRPQLWNREDTSPASVAGMLRLDFDAMRGRVPEACFASGGRPVVLVNQCEESWQMAQARELAAGLKGWFVCAGSLRRREIQCLS